MSPTLSTYSTSSSVSDVGNVESCELPSNNEIVKIVRVVSHKIVFLRSDRTDKYVKYINDVAAFGKTAPPLEGVPKLGDIVAAKFEGRFYRCVVAHIENDEIVVAFLDLGNVEKKHVNELRKLRVDLSHEKQFIFKAILSDVDDGLKNPKCVTDLYELMQKREELKFILKANTSDGVQCELRHSESVNGLLQRLNQIKPGRLVTYDVSSLV